MYYTNEIPGGNYGDGSDAKYYDKEHPHHAHVLKELIDSRSSSNGGSGSVAGGRVTPESVAKLPEFSGLPPFTVNLISLGAYDVVGRNELAERVKPVDANMPEYNRIIKASPQYMVMQNIYRDPIKFYDSTDADLDKLGISEDLKTRAKLLKDKMKGSLIINPEATLGQKGQNLENVKMFRDLDIEFSKFLSDVASEVWGVKLLEEPAEYAQNKPIPKLKELQKVVSNGGSDSAQADVSKSRLFKPSTERDIKSGSVVVYNGTRYLVRRINSTGHVQLYKEDGTKYSGTPLVKSIQQVLGYFPLVAYNGHDYIVTDQGNIYSTAEKGGLSYINDSPERSRILNEAEKYRTPSTSVNESNSTVKTTESIVPVETTNGGNKTVQTDDSIKGIVLNDGQQKAVDGIIKFLDSDDYTPVLVNGKAGTGKTTIVNEVLNARRGIEQSV